MSPDRTGFSTFRKVRNVCVDTSSVKATVVLTRENLIRSALLTFHEAARFNNYVKGPKLHECLHDLLGDGIFNADGHTWKAQRKVGSNIMTISNLKNLVSHVLDAQSQRFCNVLQQASEQGKAIDLQAAFFDLTIQTFLNIAFTTDLDSVQPTNGPGDDQEGEELSFADAFDLAQQLSVRRINNPWWRLTRRWSADEKALQGAIRKIDHCIYALIDRRSKASEVASEAKNGSQLDLLDLFLTYRDEHGQPLTPRQLRDALLNYLLAGRDTTAESLSWASFELLQHPTAIEELRSEVAEHSIRFGDAAIDHENSEDNQRSSSFDFGHTKQLHRVKAIYHESLRLHPSVPRSSKISLGDDVLPGGIFVPKGTTVIWSDWLLARNHDVWGADASEWKFERWLDREGRFFSESPWKFHAFNVSSIQENGKRRRMDLR